MVAESFREKNEILYSNIYCWEMRIIKKGKIQYDLHNKIGIYT